ncbi:hypothetical protein ANO14919_045140 [Xylariales sp. No.14919]|nr:hypothetical protein ANO14919_045140 [Xylariales sp. No.14919]
MPLPRDDWSLNPAMVGYSYARSSEKTFPHVPLLHLNGRKVYRESTGETNREVLVDSAKKVAPWVVAAAAAGAAMLYAKG